MSITSYRNITLTENYIEYQEGARTWQRERISGEAKDIFDKIMDEHQPPSKRDESKFSFEHDGVRFRGQLSHTAFKGWAISLRLLVEQIPLFSDLGIDQQIAMRTIKPKGLTLFSGPLDSGKSTSMLAAAGVLGGDVRGKTLTVEDPIEYIYKDPFTYQRQVGIDVNTTEEAIRQALRENYRTVIIGEIRTPEAMEAATQAALNGLRVLGTLHGEGSIDAIDKGLALLSPKWQKLFPRALAGVFSQILIRPGNDDEDNDFAPIAIYESLSATTAVRGIIDGGPSALLQLNNEMAAQRVERMEEMGRRLVKEGSLDQEDYLSYFSD